MSLRAAAKAKTEAAATAAKKAEDVRLSARSATLDASRATKALRRAEAAMKRAEWQLQQAEQSAKGTSERAQKAKATAQQGFATAQAEFDQAKAEMQPKIALAAKLRDEAKAAGEANATAQDEAKAAARKLAPVTMFISRATQRIYVRQAREPLLDMPVTIADADRPLGTYVFTALNYTEGETDLRWSVVSMYGAKAGPGTAAAKKRDRRADPAEANQAGAKAALDRIAIPKEALERISEVVAPGTSLIVSDEGLSRETGPATDFIVLMSGEPQGGIKIRRRSSEPRSRFQRSPSGGPWSGPSPFFFW
jgi:hypothetical protein